MRLVVRSLLANQRVLSGAQAGRQLLAKLAEVAAPLEPGPAYVDFDGVTVATASFLRESVAAYRDYARSTLPTLYPVVANASEAVAEELAFFLRHRKDAMWCCRLLASGEPRGARVLGELDEVHQSTFDLVVRLGEASAPTLARFSEEKIAPTAWNNRLASLNARGLVIERRLGKSKIFAPVLRTG